MIGTIMLANRYGVIRSFTRRGPEAVRDARQQRERRAPVRPPGAGRAPAARAPGAAAPPGVPRPAHRPRQPQPVHQPGEGARWTRAPARSRCCSSTSTTSRPSTTASATAPATSCWSAVARRLRDSVRPGRRDRAARRRRVRRDGERRALRATRARTMVAERIMKAFEQPVSAAGEIIFVHLSIGIATTHDSRRRGRADPQRRPRDVPGEGVRQGPLRDLRPQHARRGAEAPRPQGRAPEGGRARAADRRVPADRGARHRRRGRGRGARALEPPRARAGCCRPSSCRWPRRPA